MTMDIEAAIRDALAVATGRSHPAPVRGEMLLEHDLGVDSLALLEVVETLQDRLAIVIPDEVTARIRTVAELQDAVAGLAAVIPSARAPRTQT